MLLNDPGNGIQLYAAEPSGTLQGERFQPELRDHIIPPHVHVGRLAPIHGDEKEPVRTNSEDRRHATIIARQVKGAQARASRVSGVRYMWLVPAEVQAISWKAQVRLCRRYRQLTARGKHVNQVVVAIAREMAAFAWAIARLVPLAP